MHVARASGPLKATAARPACFHCGLPVVEPGHHRASVLGASYMELVGRQRAGCQLDYLARGMPSFALCLRAEVTRWAGQTRQRFTREDMQDIVAYLNRSPYRLDY